MAPQQTAQADSGRPRSRAAAPGSIAPPLRFTAPTFKKTVAFIGQHENAA